MDGVDGPDVPGFDGTVAAEPGSAGGRVATWWNRFAIGLPEDLADEHRPGQPRAVSDARFSGDLVGRLCATAWVTALPASSRHSAPSSSVVVARVCRLSAPRARRR